MNNIFDLGKEAYYNKIPRYKNPYPGEPGELWFSGWDMACKEHELFTENQSLKLENEELKKDKIELENKKSTNNSDIDTILNTLLKHLDTGVFTFSRSNIRTGLNQIKAILSRK
jgi:hypothetical protein